MFAFRFIFYNFDLSIRVLVLVMIAISNAMHKWLTGGVKRVVAVHCLAGRYDKDVLVV
jgi:hypothetical protein